tara:strand:- start:584 stop:751 length:168 start_codon:yes stop_codon:yes gene_type:complete
LIDMTKASKAAKARVKRSSASEKKAIVKAAAMLADYELITDARYRAILRATKMAC